MEVILSLCSLFGELPGELPPAVGPPIQKDTAPLNKKNLSSFDVWHLDERRHSTDAVFYNLVEDFSFTAFATISYLKVGPKARLLKNEGHVITIKGITKSKSVSKVKPSQSSNSKGSRENAQAGSKTVQDSAVKKSQEHKRPSCSPNLKAKKPKLQGGAHDQPVVID